MWRRSAPPQMRGGDDEPGKPVRLSEPLPPRECAVDSPASDGTDSGAGDVVNVLDDALYKLLDGHTLQDPGSHLPWRDRACWRVAAPVIGA